MHKKLLVALFFGLALSSSAVTHLTVSSTDVNNDLLAVYGGEHFADYLKVTGDARTVDDIMTAVTTPTLTTNNGIQLDFDSAQDSIAFSVNEALYFQGVNVNGSASWGEPQTLTINFGESGSIYSRWQFTVGQNVKEENGGSMNLVAALSTADALTLAGAGSFTRTLMAVSDETSSSNYHVFWNVSDANASITVASLDAAGYKAVRGYTTLDALNDGEYALAYTGKQVNLIVKAIPEPATATLSLLALAGLAARRKRH